MFTLFNHCFPRMNKVSEDYPTTVYTVVSRYKGGQMTPMGGVYESKDDAQAYCDAHQSEYYVYSYVAQQFVPPSDTVNRCTWPNYAYPVFYKNNSTGSVSSTNECFADGNDAADYMTAHNSSTNTFFYSIQTYYPSSQNQLTEKAIAAASIVYTP